MRTGCAVVDFFGNLEKPEHVESWIPFRMSAGSRFRTLGPDRALPPPQSSSVARRRLYLPAPAAAAGQTQDQSATAGVANQENRDSSASSSSATQDTAHRSSKADGPQNISLGASEGESPAAHTAGGSPVGGEGSRETSTTGPGAPSPPQGDSPDDGDQGRNLHYDSASPQAGAPSHSPGASSAASSQAGAASPVPAAALHVPPKSGNASPLEGNAARESAPLALLLQPPLAAVPEDQEGRQSPDGDAVNDDEVELVDANPPEPPPTFDPNVVLEEQQEFAMQVMGLEKQGYRNNWERYGNSYQNEKTCAIYYQSVLGPRVPWHEQVIASSICVSGWRNRTKVVAHIMALALGVKHTSPRKSFNWHAVSIILRCMTLLASHFPTAFVDVFEPAWAAPSPFVRQAPDKGGPRSPNLLLHSFCTSLGLSAQKLAQ